MIDEDTARKLAHLHIKNELGQMSDIMHKGEVTKIGRKQKYPLEVGRLARQAARAVADIVNDYEPVSYLVVNRYADTMVVAGLELQLIRLDFEDEGVIAGIYDLYATALQAYIEVKDLYPIEKVVLTTINAKTATSSSYHTPINIFIKGDE